MSDDPDDCFEMVKSPFLVDIIQIEKNEADCFCPRCNNWLVNIDFEGKSAVIVVCSGIVYVGKRLRKKKCRYFFYVERKDENLAR